jgi:hypothetical protein
MATASELRDIIRPRPVEEGMPQAMAFAMSMFNKQQADADKEVGREMSNLSKKYISALQAITGVKDGWIASPTPHLLSIDNEDAGITIDIHWEVDLGSGKADVTVELNRRSGPEGPGAKWKSKFHIVKGVQPTQANLSPTKIIMDAAVRRFLKEHAEELVALLREDDGWEELAEAAMNRKKLERSIYKAAGPSNRMVMRDVGGGHMMKSTLKKGAQQYVMLTGDMAKALGKSSYTNVALADLSDADLHRLAVAMRVASEEVEINDVEELRSIIEGKPSGPVKGGGQGYWSREEKKGELKKKERRSKRKEIEAQMRGEGIDEAIAFMEDGEVVLLDAVLDEAKADFVDVMDRKFTDGDYTVWVNVGKAAAKKLDKKTGYIYLRDPERRMQDASHRNDFILTVSRELGIPRERIMITPIKSPRSGDAGWKVEIEPELVPGGTKRDADTAFALLAKALSKTMLDTKSGEKRRANANEFMLMNFAKGNALFKHHDTRNYVFVDMRTGKMTVPKTKKAFNLGYFDVFEDVEPLDEGSRFMLRTAKTIAKKAKVKVDRWGGRGGMEWTAEFPNEKEFDKFAQAAAKAGFGTSAYRSGYGSYVASPGASHDPSPQMIDQLGLGAYEALEGVELDEVNKYDIRRSEEAWKDAEAIADSYKEDGDPRERKARADAEKLKKDHDALMAKWEAQKKKSREYSRARSSAMQSVGMVRTRSGRWEDDDVSKLRSIIEYKGTTYGKSKGSREADLWGSEHGEKKHVGSKRRSGHSTTAKKMAHKGERQAAKKEIQARMSGEDVSLDDLGSYLELMAEEMVEAMAAGQTEPEQPVMPMQMTNLKIIQKTADQLSRFTKEFAAYLSNAMRAKQVDVARLGQFGRQVDAAHRIFKDTYRKLALGYNESIEELGEGRGEVRIGAGSNMEWMKILNALVPDLDNQETTVRSLGPNGKMLSAHNPDWRLEIEFMPDSQEYVFALYPGFRTSGLVKQQRSNAMGGVQDAMKIAKSFSKVINSKFKAA